MKIIIEPKRSLIPSEYHKTKETVFELELCGLKNVFEAIQKCIDEMTERPEGMCGVTIQLDGIKPDDFFVMIEDGIIRMW